ncbi:MAG: peptide chain release factor N(5)-glutamine methyltransferase [Candidatus Sumerlaeia bacterium]
MLTIREALEKAAEFLRRKGIERPRMEAEILMAHALGLRRLDLYLRLDEALDEQQKALCREALRRRGEGEPAAYITGQKEFFGLPLEVGPDVLIPRPETEELVEIAAAWAEARFSGSGGDRPAGADRRRMRGDIEFDFFDVGTGSGAIAIALLHLFPRARGWASDVSAPALAVARRNAGAHGVAERLTLLEGREFAGFDGRVDLVISNPPYVKDGEAELLAPETRRFEPAGALFAGPRGTEVIEAILAAAPAVIRPGGRAMLEISPMIAPDLERTADAVVGAASWTFARDSSQKIRFLILDFPAPTV